MASLTTKIGICNRALQLLGMPTIASITENSRGAKAIIRAYDSVFQAELRSNTWRFSIKRANLVADANPVLFGKRQSYTLPGDFLFLAPEETTRRNPRPRDWEIEGQAIISDDPSPINVRYVSTNITESMFDALFAEAFSASLAMAVCEELTNSNTKKTDARQYYGELISQARKRGAMENAPQRAPTCSFITVRV